MENIYHFFWHILHLREAHLCTYYLNKNSPNGHINQT